MAGKTQRKRALPLFFLRNSFKFYYMDIIKKYFPDLSEEQQNQLAQLDGCYREWNSKINVISRKDIDNLYEHHILHSLAIAKAVSFRPGTRILDFGTGGGFPGIPLAILFPQCQFRLIDGTGKKVMVAHEIASSIRLTNVETFHRRGEEERDKFDFVVSRAVMPLPDLIKVIRKNISKDNHNALPNGVIVLKGGDLSSELPSSLSKIADVTPISNWFEEEWFKNKYVIYVPL